MTSSLCPKQEVSLGLFAEPDRGSAPVSDMSSAVAGSSAPTQEFFATTIGRRLW